MFCLLLKLIPALVAAFAAFNVAARALGTFQPPNPALAGFIEDCEGKPQPCWYGIVPGVTTAQEANAILANQDYRFIESTGWPGRAFMHYQSANRTISCGEGLFAAVHNGQIYDFNLSACAELTAGDLISLYGTPPGVCTYYSSFGMVFTREQGAVIVMLKDSPTFSPLTQVDIVYLTSNPLQSLMGWLGFKSELTYNSLYPPPNNTICY